MYTLGMRGLGDVASPTLTASSLAEIIKTQQQLLGEYFDNVTAVPQMWCLYHEVGKYYQDGLVVPDDITLLWADDNWGNAQRLPTGNESQRAAGAGLYYHFDYVGDPRDYKWINTISLQKTWRELKMAYERNTRQIWVVNVGDLKPLEIPISYYLDMAYDMSNFDMPDSTETWLTAWGAREFGEEYSNDIADILNVYGQYAARRKYELLTPATYSLINYNEADVVLAGWKNLTDKAQAVYDKLDASAQAAFFEMILHPIKAAYTVYNIYVTSAKNNLYAEERRTSANYLVQDVLSLFRQDHEITQAYHKVADGKWDQMMTQTHLGYDYW